MRCTHWIQFPPEANRYILSALTQLERERPWEEASKPEADNNESPEKESPEDEETAAARTASKA